MSVCTGTAYITCIYHACSTYRYKGHYEITLMPMDQYNLTPLRVATLCLILRYVGLCTGNSPICETCPSYMSEGYLACDQKSCDWLLINGKWAGNVTVGGDVMISDCPYGYCLFNDSSQFIWIPRDMVATIGDFLCNATHRMGVLCGQCQPGYAPTINYGGYASECVPCDEHSSKINWIYYILSVYVPLLVVFFVIIVFNIRLTTGPLNSFILFAQVISTTLDIDLQGRAPLNEVYGLGTDAFKKSYQIPYDFFNLNFFGNFLPPFCLHEKLSTLDAIALRYVVGFFPVLVIIAIVLLLRCQRCLKVGPKIPTCLQKYRVGTSLVHAFAAFVLLSYNRLCQITVYLLTPVLMFDQYLTHELDNRIYFQGDYITTDATYIVRYKLPAFLVSILLVLVPISLIHYPLMWVERLVSKVSWLRKVYPSASIAILLDMFQGCYKDNRRYFAGLYFVFRLLLFFAFLLPRELQQLIQQILIIIYVFLLAILKPYKDRRVNYLDITMFTNMSLINALSWYAVNQVVTNPLSTLVPCIITESILVFLPLVYLIAYVLWYATEHCHERAKMKMKEWYSGTMARRITRWGDVPGSIHRNIAQSNIKDDTDLLIQRQDELLQYGVLRVAPA